MKISTIKLLILFLLAPCLLWGEVLYDDDLDNSSDGSSATIRNSVIEGAYINAISDNYSSSSAINVYNCTISGSAGYLAQGHLQPNGTIRLTVGNGTAAYTSELSNDTTYHIWVAYTAGSIGNGSVSLYAGTGLTRPASPLATATNGAAVGDAIRFRIYTGGVTATVDQILVDGSSFSEVCK